MRSFDWKAGLPFALALAANSVIPQYAFAQFYFRPFAYSYGYQFPDEGPPAYASRPAVASILGRAGYQLVGPLGHRGDQIVATGVSRRDGEMRFIVDPYEGRILRAVRLGPPPMHGDGPERGGYGPGDGAPYGPHGAGPGSSGSGPAARGFDAEHYPETDAAPGGATLDNAPNGTIHQRASAAKRGTSSNAPREIAPQKPMPPTAVAPASPPASASAVASPAMNSKPAPVTNASAQGSRPSVEVVGTSPEKPATSAERSAPARRAAGARAASSRRAIVPPHTPSETTIVKPEASAPSVPGANGSASAPDEVGKPEAGG
ncbi:MAG: hypothetical protein FJX48_01505 [Alphaproteobacteria bacterium]|nr:hypothetical protein [Alphaproteobacteria bacterium]